MAALARPQQRVYEVGPQALTSAGLLQWMAGPPASTGVRISEETALRVSDVYKCVNVLSQSVAMLSLPVYRRLARGKERAPQHPVYPLLHDAPNPWMTSYDFRACLMAHRALWGNAFAEIDRDDNGTVRALYPLRPDRMERPVRSQAGTLIYPYTLPDGEKRNLPQDRVLHLRGLSSDGLWGYSVIAAARESIGLAKAGEQYGGKFFSNNARPGGVLEAAGTLSPEGAKRLADSWNAAHQGLEQAHRIAVLEEGVTFKAVGIPPHEAQWIELRKFQRSDIAGIFRIPPHLIGDLERATFSNIEQQALEFVVHTLQPWLVSCEQALNQALFTEIERRTFFAEFLVDSLLRGDSTARGQFYSTLFNLGALSSNDIREKENANPIEGGDQYFAPLNMVPLEQVGQPQQPAAGDGGNDEAKATADRDLAIGRSLLNIQRLEEVGELAAAELERVRLREMYGVPADYEPEPPEPAPAQQPQEQQPAEGDGSVEEQNSLPAGERRSLQQRQALRKVWAPILQQAAGRIVKREVDAIRLDGLDRTGERAGSDFLVWLETFEREQLAPEIERTFAPLFAAYAAAVEREVLDELEIVTLQEQLGPFVESYTANLAATYTARSVAQLGAIVRDTPPAELVKALEQRLSEWLDNRPARVAHVESVRAGEAVTHHTYRRAGVQRVRWRTSGKNCPFCAKLDGKVVGIQEHFAAEGEEIQGNEGEEPLRVRRRASYPPLHGSCNCGLVKE